MAKNRTFFPEEKNGICVVKRDDEDIEDLIKRFRKKFSKSGVANEVRQRMYFEKPSDKKRRKKAQSIRNIEKEEEKLRLLKEKAKKLKLKRQRKERKNDKRSERQNNYGKTYEDKTRRDYSS